jgi:DNA helicase-2/ATP-dependent DNA helicase PcrA
MVLLTLIAACMKDKDDIAGKAEKRLKNTSTKKGPAPSPRVGALLDSCRRLAGSATLDNMAAVLNHFQDKYAFRPEPIRTLRQAMKMAQGVAGLAEAITATRERERRMGRRLPHYGMGTTLLVKGMDAEHVIVMDIAHMKATHLYVALT